VDAKLKYRELCGRESSISLFMQDWWLDAVCGPHSWAVALVEKKGEIHAALPYRLSKRYGQRILSQPPYTPYLGPWLRNDGGKATAKYSREKELISGLIDGLPRFDHFRQCCLPDSVGWLPFYWKKFSQTTFYTYILEDISDPDSGWKLLRDNIRGDIKKASGRFGVSVREGGIEDIIELQDMSFRRQGRAVSAEADLIRTIGQACFERDCGQVLIARDGDGRAHAGAFVVWDSGTTYYLIGGGNPELRNSGAASLCLGEAIRFASSVSKRFDFEGSMVEPIERFFRAFGATQVPYHCITKTSSPLLKLMLALTGR
jgi:hypothetical protein